MSGQQEIREDSAIYGIMLGFPFAEGDFTAGFEAGMLWQTLWTGKEVIEAVVNSGIVEGIGRLAEKRGYALESRGSGIKHYAAIRLTDTERRDPTQVAQFAITGIERIERL